MNVACSEGVFWTRCDALYEDCVASQEMAYADIGSLDPAEAVFKVYIWSRPRKLHAAG